MTNSLIHESSPYLKNSAHQPVQWLPWSQAAFDRAKHENKPVFLGIGAMWCHWCHVMDRENYEDPEIASLINENFVPVKVDRDEHPEVDRRYQAAVTAMIGEAGWPLTAFLTPEGDLFAGGTYFPPDPRWGRRGLRETLREVAETYRTAGASVRSSANEIREAQAREPRATPPEAGPQTIENAVRGMIRDFDFLHAAFGEAPRFPHPCALEFLMAVFFRSKDQNLESLIRKSLDRMAMGGIHDQLGGGFHRYATGQDWSSPHFEKILADNAEMLRLYTRASCLFQDSLYRETAEAILNWARSCMTDPDGGFFHSQDSDVGPEDDGGYYTWTHAELREPLTDKELQVVSAYYNIRSGPARNVLHNDRALEEVAEELKIQPSLAHALLVAGRDKLSWARRDRAQPQSDPTLYTSANALMISACLETARSLNLPDAEESANRALHRIIEQAWTGQGFAHTVNGPANKLPGLLEDQVYAGIALLESFLLTANPQYLNLCTRVAEILASQFQDQQTGGFFDVFRQVTDSNAAPLAPLKPIQDTPAPGANPAAAIFFQRLHSITGDVSYRNIAARALHAIAGEAQNCGVFAGTYFLALQQHLEGIFEIFVIGETDHPAANALAEIAWQTYRPRKQVRRLSADSSVPDPVVMAMIDFIRSKRRPMAFVCVQGGCAAPVEDPSDLRNLILTFNP